jgi:hypothetical protein
MNPTKLFIVSIPLLVIPANLVSGQVAQKLPADAELRQKIVGVWGEAEQTNRSAHFVATSFRKFTFAANGTQSCVSTMKITPSSGSGKPTTDVSTTKGTWQIRGGCLVTTVAALDKPGRPSKQLPKPMTSSGRIIRLNDQELVCAAADPNSPNKVVTFHRSK